MMKITAGNIEKEITSRLVNEFKPEIIFLFGSHAWGVPDNDSDYDIMVIVSDSYLKPAIRSFKAIKCMKGLKIPVDIMVKTKDEFYKYKNIYASLESRIIEQGKVLYERKN